MIKDRNNQEKIAAIDDILPQTQCRLCGYDGCLPYAEAIVAKNAEIDRCLPGGTSTLLKLAKLTGKDATPFLEEMAEKAKPPMLAKIDSEACIGCTKCIQACPVDAIIGAPQRLHIVLTEQCTGCELCVAPCPVDCITMVRIPETAETAKTHKAAAAKKRHEARKSRLTRLKEEKTQRHNKAKMQAQDQHKTLEARRNYIQEAITRAKAKKSSL